MWGRRAWVSQAVPGRFSLDPGKIASEVSRPGRAAQGSGAREGFSEGMWHLGARVGLAVPGERLDPVPGMNF